MQRMLELLDRNLKVAFGLSTAGVHPWSLRRFLRTAGAGETVGRNNRVIMSTWNEDDDQMKLPWLS